MAEEAKTTAAVATKATKATKVNLPELKEVLRAGMQFGHETKRWNPKMADFIFGKKNDIHIIDISKSLPLLKVAGDFLAGAIAKGPVLFLGTKRQAADILGEAAVEAGVHFVNNRWAGGLLSNFTQIKKSIDRLNELEKMFEEGVTGRTKYEISQMKKDWERLTRLYGGVKTLKSRPVAVFVVDPSFEKGAVRECNFLDIPVAAMVDTNSDYTVVDYPIPANDDAIRSIKLVVEYIKARIMEVESPHRITHKFKDYTKVEVAIKKASDIKQMDVEEIASAKGEVAKPAQRKAIPAATVAKNKAAMKANAGAQAGSGAAKGGASAVAKAGKTAAGADKGAANSAGQSESGILGKYQAQKAVKVARKS
jgi:small subunit ribosomal protein S2